MPTETVAAPSTPTPVAQSASAPSQVPKAAPTAIPPIGKPRGPSFSDEIDALANAKPKETPKAKVEPAKVEKPTIEAPEKPAEASKPTDKPDAPKAEPEKAKSHTAMLRDAHETLKGKYKTLEAEHAKLKSAKPVEDADKPILNNRVTELEKRNQELEERIKFANYEYSDEYKKKYAEPYQKTANDATNRAVQYKVQNPDGTSRNLTKDEFWKIVGIGDENDALVMAESIFGENNPRVAQVIERRNEILAAHQKGQQAIEDYRTQGVERNKSESEKLALERSQSESSQKKLVERFDTLVKEREESKPEYNKADDGDEQGVKVLNLGSAMGDLAFGRFKDEQKQYLPQSLQDKMEANGGKLPPEDMAEVHASMRAAMREAPFVKLKLNRALARQKELEAELAEYKESEPMNAGGARRQQGAKKLGWSEEIDQLASKGNRLRR